MEEFDDEYDADGGIKDVGVNVAAQYNFTESWGILGALKYNRLLDDAEDSPIVDDQGNENQYFFSVAAVYSF